MATGGHPGWKAGIKAYIWWTSCLKPEEIGAAEPKSSSLILFCWTQKLKQVEGQCYAAGVDVSLVASFDYFLFYVVVVAVVFPRFLPWGVTWLPVQPISPSRFPVTLLHIWPDRCFIRPLDSFSTRMHQLAPFLIHESHISSPQSCIMMSRGGTLSCFMRTL